MGRVFIEQSLAVIAQSVNKMILSLSALISGYNSHNSHKENRISKCLKESENKFSAHCFVRNYFAMTVVTVMTVAEAQ